MEVIKKKKEVVIIIDGNMPHTDITEYINKFNDIPNIPKVRTLSISHLGTITDDVLFVSIISDIHSLNTDESLKLLSLYFNNELFAITTNDNDYFGSFCNDESKIVSIDEMLTIVRFEFNPKNILVGFISSDIDHMNDLFSDLRRTINDNTIGIYDLPVPNGTPVGYLPKIFEGWIQSIWYGKSKDDIRGHYTSNNTISEICSEPGEATIAKIVTAKFEFGQSITYVWIMPSIETNIESLNLKFHTLYVDVTSNYNELNLPDKDSNDFELIPMVLYDIGQNGNYYNEKTYMNIMHNLYKMGYYHLITNNSKRMIDEDISKSVYGYDKAFEAYNFTFIEDIDPYLDIKKGE